jgi:hypothetical protein
MAGERRGSFFEGTPGNRSSGDGAGPVAQRIRARGYEPRCRGFESLLAHTRLKGGREIMIGMRESNPRLLLGKEKFYHSTISAFFLFYAPELCLSQAGAE